MEEFSDILPQKILKIDENGDDQNESVSTISAGAAEDEKTKFLVGNSNDEPDALPKDPHYRNLDMSMTTISIITYIFDLVMDCIVAFHFFHLGVSHEVYHYWYFGLTLTFILIPSLTMTGFSLRWYLQDADNTLLPPVTPWRWILRIFVLLFQIAPILRYLDSIRYGLLSRKFGQIEKSPNLGSEKKKEAREQRIKYYTLMVYEDADATLLRLFECFMESAPQLILQIYILIRDPRITLHLEENPNSEKDLIKESILVISILSSLCSLAWSLVVYHRSLRYSLAEKNNLNATGSILQFLWHLSSITARVIALSLFASKYPKLIGPVCVAHWIIMSIWVVFQNTQACNTKCEELLFCLVLGAIYIFSFFNAKEERTRYKYLIYYTFCFCENSALIFVWFITTQDTQKGQWYYYPGIIGHYVSFFAGLFFMIIYYVYFHPTGIEVEFFNIKRGSYHNQNNITPSELLDTENQPIIVMPTSSENSQKTTHEIELRTLLLQEQTNNKKKSLSTPVLDEKTLAELEEEKNLRKEKDNHKKIRKTLSEPPSPESTWDQRKIRTLKAMSRDGC